MLGNNKDVRRLTGLRNIKSDFNYAWSKDKNATPVEIIKKLYKEREENINTYQHAGKTDLWLQEHVEAEILLRWLPEEPSKLEVFVFLNSLNDIPRKKSSFKKLQDACASKFGQKIDSAIILEYLNGE